MVKAAEAQADAAQLQGKGIARQRRAIIDGLRRPRAKFVDQYLGFPRDLYLGFMLISEKIGGFTKKNINMVGLMSHISRHYWISIGT